MNLFSQTLPTPVNPFLDSTFLESDNDRARPETIPRPPETAPRASSTTFNFNLINLPGYHLINPDNPYDPADDLFFPGFDDLLQVHTRLQYLFGSGKITFNWDSSLYVLAELTEQGNGSPPLTVNPGYYLNEISIRFQVTDITALEVGKIITGEGSAFLINPTDFLARRIDYRDASIFYPNRTLGSYQIKFDLSLKNWSWGIAYLPTLKTPYDEFTRKYPNRDPYFGELWSRFAWQADNVVTKFIFYWNGYAQGGVNISAGLGDEVILFFDGAGKAVADYSIDPEEPASPYRDYRIQKKYSYRGQGLLGISYTPANLFTVTTEVFGNIGEENRRWDDRLDELNTLANIAGEIENSSIPNLLPLADKYRGLMNELLNHHDPLALQPVFIAAGINRDDAFADFSPEVFNLSTRLIYSPMDTGFLWLNHLMWQAPEVMTLGLFTSWVFGKKNGVFTSIPQTFSVGLATRFDF